MSSYYTVRTDEGLKVCFAVKQSNGSLRTGLVAGDFLGTVINPADSATLVVGVAEMAQKTGMYCFTLTSGFMGTHGVGVYPFAVEVDTFGGPSGSPNVRDVISGNVRAQQEDVDALADGLGTAAGGAFVRATDSLVDIKDAAGASSPSAIATAVWSEALPGAFGAGEAGERLATTDDRMDVVLSTRASQVSVDGLSNAARFVPSIPKILVPDAGTADYAVIVNLFDGNANPEDPDESSIRSIATNAGDSITSATKRIVMVNGAFTTADVNRTIRVSASGAGNNGDYTILAIISGTEVEVRETIPSDEASGFAGEIISWMTLSVFDQAEVDVSTRLFSLELYRVGLGRFRTEYTSTAGDGIENLRFEFTFAETAVTQTHDRSVTSVFTLEDNFTAADRVVLNNIETDTTAIEADTQDIQGRLPAALVGGRMDSDVAVIQAGAITPAAVATDAIDADALATSAVNEIRDGILSDSTPFPGASIDATISSRATQSSVDDIEAAIASERTIVVAGSTVDEVRTPLTQADGFFRDGIIIVINVNGTVARRIDDYENTNGAFFPDQPFPFTPGVGETVIVLARHQALAGAIG